MEAAYDCPTESLDGKDNRFGPCPIGVLGGRVDLVVIGDSHGVAMKPALLSGARLSC